MNALTEQERALIDAAVAQGKVRKCAPGESGHPGYRWCKKKKALLPIDGGKPWRPVMRKGPSPQVAARRARIADMAATMTVAQMAVALDVTESLVRQDLSALRVSFKRERPTLDEVAERREVIARMTEKGMKRGEIAKALGITVHTVDKDRRVLRRQVGTVS